MSRLSSVRGTIRKTYTEQIQQEQDMSAAEYSSENKRIYSAREELVDAAVGACIKAL